MTHFEWQPPRLHDDGEMHEEVFKEMQKEKNIEISLGKLKRKKMQREKLLFPPRLEMGFFVCVSGCLPWDEYIIGI